jgi:hypothetical protein
LKKDISKIAYGPGHINVVFHEKKNKVWLIKDAPCMALLENKNKLEKGGSTKSFS